MRDLGRGLPYAWQVAGAVILIGYLGFVAVMIYSGWSDIKDESGWDRNKEAVEMVGGAFTVLVAALAGFLVQEPAKKKMAKDVRIVGAAYLNERDANRRTVADSGQTPMPADVGEILAEYGM